MEKKQATSKTKRAASSDGKVPCQPKEKRLKRHRSKPTIGIQSRIDRALSQRLFLVEMSQLSTCPINGGPSITLTVLGSTGNVYEVTVSKIPNCNCPDHGKGNLCKHLLFAMLKVANLPASSPLVYQSAYVTEELEAIIGTMQTRTARHVAAGDDANFLANEAVRNRVQKKEAGSVDDNDIGSKAERKEIEENDDCPICFDELGSDLALLTYCRETCGTNFHSECIRMWTSQHRTNPTCPACRQPWADATRSGEGNEERNEGYENLASLQGQSRVRDTSTYSSPSNWGYKRRRYY